MRHPIPGLPAARFGVFTGREAAAVGWTPSALRHGVDQGGVLRIRRGCFALAPDPTLSAPTLRDRDLAQRTVAATLASKQTHGSHLGAAIVLGAPTWALDPQPCVTTRRDCALRGVHVHHAQPRPGHFGTVGGVPLTSPERTVVDIAREYGPESALVVADAMVRRGLVDRTVLTAFVDELGFDLDVDAARVVLRLLDPGAESPLESRSRWQLHAYQVAAPLSQVEIRTPAGLFVGRTDFYWPEGVVGEVDGSAKYDAPEVLVREKWRQERLEALGLRVVRWGAAELLDFAATAARIERGRTRARGDDRERLWVAVHPALPAA